jgi:Fis family transcriptional regulator, factor for inversion stimulation protein
VRDLLEQLVGEMVDKGIRYQDAQREFEKRFITKVVQASAGNLCRAADVLGVHRNTLSRKMKELKVKARTS